MTDETLGRIGIAASIVGAVGALAYLLRGNPSLIAGPAGPQGATGATGAALTGAAGVAGTPGATGRDGTAGAAGAPGTPGTPGLAASNSVPGGDAINGTAGGTPTMQSLTQYFVQSFYPPDSGQLRPDVLTYNASPFSDLGKRFMSVANAEMNPPKSGGCGCGGHKPGGCGGKKKSGGNCPNAQSAFRFPDGQGGCLSSTYGSLTAAMENCAPGFVDSMIKNMASNVMYYGYDSNPVGDLRTVVAYQGSKSAPIHDFADMTISGFVLGTDY